jgi:glutaminyl-peptide cyclotransferase
MIRTMTVSLIRRILVCGLLLAISTSCGAAPVTPQPARPEATGTLKPVASVTKVIATPAPSTQQQPPTPTPAQTVLPVIASHTVNKEPELFGIEVVARYPHDPGAFTQGLVFSGSTFLESTGLNGRSSLREVDIISGRVLRKRDIDAGYFAEGLARIGDRLYQLTWQNQIGFVYDLNFEPVQTWSYTTEGWGLAYDGAQLIMSDGSNRLFFINPATLAVEREIAVTRNGLPVVRLNELEWVDGRVYANIWQTNEIVIIDPANGLVTGSIDLSSLYDMLASNQPVDVLNGIAYDAATRRLWVTGKLWPEVFEVKLVPR